MSPLLSTGRENALNRSGNIGLCSYCHKTFKDLRVLGDHLRSHRGHALARKSPVNVPEAAPYPLTGTPQSSAALPSPPPPPPPPPPVFPKRFGYENAIGNAKASFSVSANFSPGGDRAEICHVQSWSYQINSDQSRSFGDGGQFSENALPGIQNNNKSQGNFLIPRFGSNVGPVYQGQSQYSGLGDSEGYNGKRYYVCEDFPVPAMVKRARTDVSLMIEEAERRQNINNELFLFQDPGFGNSRDAVENPKPVLDLTLRL